MTGQTDHEKAVEAVAAKLRSPSTFPGDTATAVARELIDSYLKAIPSPSSQSVVIELNGVAEQLADGAGAWRSCSGCHNLNEGHPTGEWSDVLKCHLGMGCFECGGIGAIWDNVDYSDFGKEEPAEQVTVEEYAKRLFDLHGFMLLETYRDKPAVTVTFPDIEQAQQFHSALVDLSTHRPRPQSLSEYATQRASAPKDGTYIVCKTSDMGIRELKWGCDTWGEEAWIDYEQRENFPDAWISVSAIEAFGERCYLPPAPLPHLRVTLQRIADEISALKLHPTTSEDYDAGYVCGRNDAFAIVQEAIDNLPAILSGSFAERAADLVKRSPPDFAAKDQHVEWGGEAFILLEEIAALAATSEGVE